jgi:hypothetical protein
MALYARLINISLYISIIKLPDMVFIYRCVALSTFYYLTWYNTMNHMVVGFTTTCAISAYHHESCEIENRSWRDVLDTTLCDQVCQWLATGQWFSPGTPVSSNKRTITPLIAYQEYLKNVQKISAKDR